MRDSHFAVNDVPATFFVTLALLAAIRLAQSGDRKWYILAGVSLGLGFATKYSAALAIVPVMIAHFYAPQVHWRPKPNLYLGRLSLIALTAIVAAIVASPYFVLTPAKVVRDVYEALYLAGQQGFEGWMIDAAGGYIFYIKTMMWGLGVLLFALVLLGLGAAILRHFPKDVILFSLPLTIYLVAGQQEMYFARFILPAVPALLVLAAALLEKVAVSFIHRPRSASVAIAGLTLLVMAQPLASAFRFDYLLTRPDTRTLAADWIEANLPQGSKIALDWRTHGPPLATSEQPVPDASRAYDVFLVGETGLSEHPIPWYQENGFDYLVSSSFISEIGLASPEQDISRRAFYASLPAELELLQTFRPTATNSDVPFIFDEIYGPAVSLLQRERPGPTLKVYRLK